MSDSVTAIPAKVNLALWYFLILYATLHLVYDGWLRNLLVEVEDLQRTAIEIALPIEWRKMEAVAVAVAKQQSVMRAQ